MKKIGKDEFVSGFVPHHNHGSVDNLQRKRSESLSFFNPVFDNNKTSTSKFFPLSAHESNHLWIRYCHRKKTGL